MRCPLERTEWTDPIIDILYRLGSASLIPRAEERVLQKHLSKSLQRPPTRPSWPGGLAARSLRTAGTMGCADIYRHVLEAWSSLMTTRGKGRSPPKVVRPMDGRMNDHAVRSSRASWDSVLQHPQEPCGAFWGSPQLQRPSFGQDGRMNDRAISSARFWRIHPYSSRRIPWRTSILPSMFAGIWRPRIRMMSG